ncbi:hypothetical protein GCM10010174_57620 [Kutzneria viridogrisea]|uniref:Uncharacterized protein n=2 Tax=Kutzneria TaxID=43356 RepID=W5W390_9PSEU|nr:hypothetical protein [Kutzneria albida]AHH95250.1 hypothetical protein KALB_1880 [Kutzneria albida DSM 43870]MBA8927393.1 hypothetical protein [Kutzneria viridogrisea]
MTKALTKDELRPTHPLVRAATIVNLGLQFEVSELQNFLDQIGSDRVPPAIGATASVKIAIWGKVRCEPDGQPWVYDTTIWGGPAYFGDAIGLMYTAYDSWNAFFQNVTSVHVQGVASGGGILQINWFNQSGTPVGQFNGAAAGVGALQAGGSGKWSRK